MLELSSQRASRLVMWAPSTIPSRCVAHTSIGNSDRRPRWSTGATATASTATSMAGTESSPAIGGHPSLQLWMPRDELMRALTHYNWRDIKIPSTIR